VSVEKFSEKRWEDARTDLADFYDELSVRRFWDGLDEDERDVVRAHGHLVAVQHLGLTGSEVAQ
jgi:hypothetical protein